MPIWSTKSENSLVRWVYEIITFIETRRKKHSKAVGSSSSGSDAVGNAPSGKADDATIITSTTSAATQIAVILSAWDQKTSEEQDAWCAEIFRDEGPPWKGVVAYDDGGDIEYEEKIAGGRT